MMVTAFVLSFPPPICQIQWDRALKKGGKNRGGKASKYNQDCLYQWALQKDSVFMWLSQGVGLQCSLMLCIPYCSYLKCLFFFQGSKHTDQKLNY